MASSTAISVEEYLHSSYRPDCDYVDGELVERNVGELKHSFLQNILGGYLRELSRRSGIRVATELRMRISPTRFRIPDLTVMLRSQPLEPVPAHPPFLCVEIVSPDDRMIHILERVKEYLAFGVNHVWVLDPASRTAYSYTQEEGREVRDRLTTQNPEISISLAELFAELDEALRDDA
ncbi:MAG TPA: Uma2 family endonuclease [Bryobacteraceae bacterium]|jgi:Uma2 family endonuclease|nr:Uma2 family endonuclease [Bryobacteraceae bacterium]